jgi:hypothetical protein
MRISRTVNRWPIEVRYFWTQLWGYCDDYGRGRYDSKVILADTFPIDDKVTAADITRWMKALERSEVIHRYEVDGRVYFQVASWDEHQPMRYKRKSRIPDPLGKIPQSSAKFQNFSPEGEVEEEVDREGEDATPPSPFCPKHPTGTDHPCRACGNARNALTAWTAKQRTKPSPPATMPKPSQCKHPKGPDEHGYCTRCGERIA